MVLFFLVDEKTDLGRMMEPRLDILEVLELGVGACLLGSVVYSWPSVSVGFNQLHIKNMKVPVVYLSDKVLV